MVDKCNNSYFYKDIIRPFSTHAIKCECSLLTQSVLYNVIMLAGNQYKLVMGREIREETKLILIEL